MAILEAKKKLLAGIQSALHEMDQTDHMEEGEEAFYNALVEQHNDLVDEIEAAEGVA